MSATTVAALVQFKQLYTSTWGSAQDYWLAFATGYTSQGVIAIITALIGK